MMKKHLKIILVVVTIITLGVFVLPNIAMAQATVIQAGATLLKLTTGVAIGEITIEVIVKIINVIFGLILTVVSKFVTVSGIFLSLSIKLSLNIKKIYDGSIGIEYIWRTVRDISSMFIIFILIFESIKTILGIKGADFSKTIVKIFIAGMLINFSLFFFKTAVDVSNLVSLQFYNAITPGVSENLDITSSFKGGGLSDVFMQSLKIPKIYNSVNLSLANRTLNVTFVTVAGIIMMITAAFSFLGAAIAFTIRTAVLLFLMAISPLYFAGMIFPEIEKKVSNRILDNLWKQCMFMPIYLFLMYIALKVISDDGFLGYFKDAKGDETSFILAGVIIQFIVAIIFINMPLIMALEFGAIGMKWVPGVDVIGKNLSKRLSSIGYKITGAVGRNTAGVTGEVLGGAFDNMASRAQSSSFGRGASTVLRTVGVSQAVRGGLKSMEQGKYGSKQSREDIEKENKARAREINAISRKNQQMAIIDKVAGKVNVPAADVEAFKTKISEMTSKDVESLGIQRLTDTSVAATLSAKQVEALLKSDSLSQIDKDKFTEARFKGIGGAYLYDDSYIRKQKMSEFEAIMKEDFTKDQKDKLRDARKTAYEKIANTEGARKLLKDVLKGNSSEIAKLPVDILKRTDVAVLLDALSLKKMLEESSINTSDRADIRKIIQDADATKQNDQQLRQILEKAKLYLVQNVEF